MYTKLIPTQEQCEFIVLSLVKPMVRSAYLLSLVFIYVLLKGIQWYLDRTAAIGSDEPVKDVPVKDVPVKDVPAMEPMPFAKQTRRTKKGAV